MLMEVKRAFIGILVALAFACTGPVGPPGPQGPQGEPGAQGPQGDQGPGFETGPSISGLYPSWVYQGESQRIQISGFATEWTTGTQPTISFGTGITVERVIVASDTALVVDVVASMEATVGVRSVIVSQGEQQLSFSGAFEVRPLVSFEYFGTSRQGSMGILEIQRNTPQLVLPQRASDIAVETPTGVGATFLGATENAARLLVMIDLDAVPSTGELVVRTWPGTQDERVLVMPLLIDAADLQSADVTGSISGTFDEPWDTVTFTGIASVDQTVVAWVETSSGGAVPSVAVLDGTGKFPGIYDGLAPFTMTTGTTYTLVVFSNGTSTGDFTLNLTTPPVVGDIEPNNSMTEAQTVVALPFTIVGGNVDTSDSEDWFRFNLPPLGVGKRMYVQMTDGSADVAVTLVDEEGVELGTSTNLFWDEQWVSPPFRSAGTWYLRARLAPPDFYSGTYELSIVVQ